MHTIKVTPNLLFEYQCTSGKYIRLPNRIESKLFLPELECSTTHVQSHTVTLSTRGALRMSYRPAAAMWITSIDC